MPLAPGPYTVTATFSYRIGADWAAPEYSLQETVPFDWPPGAIPSETPSPTPTVFQGFTPVADCTGAPDNRPCVGPCGPCNSSVSGYCRGGECVTECAPCTTPTETPTPAPCGQVCDNRPCGEFTCPGSNGLPQTRFCDVSYFGGCQCSPIECPTTPTPTPAPPFGRCRHYDECQQSGGRCLAPGEFPGCGPTPAPVPTLDRCQVDTDCRSRGDAFICTPVDPRTCEFGLACVAGCRTDGDCAVGEACDLTHRCVPHPCTFDADCPALFACPNVSEGQRGCYRRTCVTDPDCLGGFCVTGSCYDQLGACATPPA
jgi:hypothetical protein